MNFYIIQEQETSKVYVCEKDNVQTLIPADALNGIDIKCVSLTLCKLQSSLISSHAVVLSLKTFDPSCVKRGKVVEACTKKKMTHSLYFSLRMYTIFLKLSVWEQNLIESSTEEENFEGAAKWLSAIKGVIGKTMTEDIDLDWR
jgi:hypothetical protein